jgi:glycerol-3-phosphate dehydrogenase
MIWVVSGGLGAEIVMRMSAGFDVAVIGGGVVGCAIARNLAHFEIGVCLIEAQADVGMGTSKANTAVFHTGFDAAPGTLEATLLRRSYPLLRDYCDATGIAYQINGALMIAWNQEQLDRLPEIEANARRNGVDQVERLYADTVYAREPNLGPGVRGGLLIHEEGILCPFSPVLAFAAEAKTNGTRFYLNAPVQNIQRESDDYVIEANGQEIRTSWIVNAAGLFSDEIDRLMGQDRFRVAPRKGELIVYDKFASSLLQHTLLPIPSTKTKGVLVCPTVFGNVLLGPTAEDIDDKKDTETSVRGLASLLDKGKSILPGLMSEEITSTYAGLRAATRDKDYQIHIDGKDRYACAGGIRSTGLSASMGIAEYVVETMASSGLKLREKSVLETIKVPPLGEHQLRPYRNNALIRLNADYGRIVCHCEKVTRGELIDTFLTELPPPNLDGLRRRTRCLQGRCQGFYCQAEVDALLRGRD